MKYDRKKLIARAELQIAALKKDVDASKRKVDLDWRGYKQGLIADAKIYLQALKAWAADPHSQPPHLNQRYQPSSANSQAKYQVDQLEQLIKQLNLSSEDLIDFKTSYDMTLLNILCK